jgi:hypothetical protein
LRRRRDFVDESATRDENRDVAESHRVSRLGNSIVLKLAMAFRAWIGKCIFICDVYRGEDNTCKIAGGDEKDACQSTFP